MRIPLSRKICNHFNVKYQSDVNTSEKYNYIINEIGLENCKLFLPYNKGQLINLYKQDRLFNNEDLDKWNLAGQLLLQYYANKLNINAWSLADCCCIVKQVARRTIGVEYNG